MKARVLMTTAALAVSLGLAAPVALAQDAVANPDFATADSDGDGIISLVELQALMADYDQAQYDALDIDKSGGLDEEEFASLATLQNEDATGAVDAPETTAN